LADAGGELLEATEPDWHEGLKMSAVEWSIQLARYLDEEPDMVATRGWLSGSIVELDGCRIPIAFYDPIRLAQSIDTQVRAAGYYCEGAVIVVPSVTRANIEKAVASIAARNWSELRSS
jgi:hypothetical protein